MKQITYSVNAVAVDLSAYTARMHVREKYTSASTLVTLTSDGIDGRITLGGASGTVDLFIDADTTTLFVAKDYVYDLELVSAGIVTRLLEGKFIVTPEVTK